MKRKFFKTVFICIIFVLLSSQSSLAKMINCTGEGCLQFGSQGILEKFKNVIGIGAVSGITIPTVVGTTLQTPYTVDTFALFEKETGRFAEGILINKAIKQNYTIGLSTDPGTDIAVLHDMDVSTFLDIPSEGLPTTTSLVYTAVKPVKSSQLIITSANFAQSPTSVSVYAYDPQTFDKKLLVYSVPLSDNAIYFPDTTSSKWEIIFNHKQPLRLTEIQLADQNAESVQSLQFLAQPGLSYDLYIYPEGYVSVPVQENSIGLDSATNVRQIMSGQPQVNPLYKAVDSDGDGVFDSSDNCPNIANKDQKKTDPGNTLGDACSDFDRDGVVTSKDNCSNIPNADQIDTDGDGKGDLCDPQESRLTEKYPWIPLVGIAVGFGATLLIFAVTVKGKNDKEKVEEERTGRTIDM